MSLPNSNAKPNLSQKTREEIKAEREAKKAAKTAAKAAKINKVDNAKNVAPVNCKISTKNARTDVAAEKVLKENVIQSSNVQNNASESKNEGKSKAELRAERRAKQEAQRAAKQQQLVKNNIKSEESLKPRVETVSSECPVKKSVMNNTMRENAHTVNLFKHLYQERERSLFNIATVNSNIHPAIVRLGVQYANKVIVGSNARCVALLAAVKQVIQDFEKPIHEDFIRGLEANLKESLKYLCHCRPLGVSMHNAMRHLTWQMTQFSSTLSDEKAKSKLQGIIDTYISEQIQLADKAISLTIQSKISDGNVILTYGYSSLIHKILVEAHAAGKQFRVVVVDGRPWLEGKEQLRRLAKHGIECSYILINALSFIMPEVSKVFLGAHAILANGAVMSRVGTAQIALMAKAFNVPVLVACETHKSSERVQTDSIVHNELGNADDLVNHQLNGSSKKSLLSNWRTRKSLNLLNITYDVTPADLVTAVVTELAILPCTSVPVILRIKPSEV
ncbi:EI2BD factor, partial [Acromyrmex insinuator]